MLEESIRSLPLVGS